MKPIFSEGEESIKMSPEVT